MRGGSKTGIFPLDNNGCFPSARKSCKVAGKRASFCRRRSWGASDAIGDSGGVGGAGRRGGAAAALDKVKFGTNWLADAEAGGFYQALVDGTYAQHGLDVTIIPGGPQTNGALMLLYGMLDFFMGGDQIGDFICAESKLPLSRWPRTSRKARRFSCLIPAWTRQMGGFVDGEAGLRRGRRDPDLLCLAQARLRVQGREHQAVQFQLRGLHE